MQHEIVCPIIPMSMFRELCYGVVRYINDPATFAAFSLTHSACWKAALEFSPLKKVEFSRLIPDHDFSVLPNGALHGRSTTHFVTFIYNNSHLIAKINDFVNGYFVALYPNDRFRKYRTRELVIVLENVEMLSEFHPILMVVTWKRVRNFKHPIYAYKCWLCRKYHTFTAHNYFYRGTCFHNGLIIEKIMENDMENYIYKYMRRMQISRAIVTYAKELKRKGAT